MNALQFEFIRNTKVLQPLHRIIQIFSSDIHVQKKFCEARGVQKACMLMVIINYIKQHNIILMC